MLEKIIVDILSRYTDKYLLDFDSKKLKIGLFSGDIVLKDLKLRPEALDDLNLPIAIVAGSVASIVIKVPWRSLKSKPVVVQVRDIFILAKSCSVTPKEYDAVAELKKANALKKQRLNDFESTHALRMAAKSSNSGFVAKLQQAIINNIQVNIENIHVRLQFPCRAPGCPVALGLCLRSLSLCTANSNWEPHLVAESEKPKGEPILKLLDITDLSLYCDSTLGDPHCPLFRAAQDPSRPGRFPSELPLSASEEWLLQSIGSVEDREAKHQYILSPLALRLQLTMQSLWAIDRNLPKTSATVNIGPGLALGIARPQYISLLCLYEHGNEYAKLVRYARFRPACGRPVTKASAAAWWTFALKSVSWHLEDNKKKLSFSRLQKQKVAAMEYRGLFLRSLIKHKGDLMDEHGHKFKTSDFEGGALSAAEVTRLAELEDEHDADTLIRWRQASYVRLDAIAQEREIAAEKAKDEKAKDKAKKGGFFSRVFGSKAHADTATNNDNDDTDSGSEAGEVPSFLGQMDNESTEADENDSEIVPSYDSPDHVKTELIVVAPSLKILVGDSSGMIAASLRLEHANIKVRLRPSGMDLGVALRDITVKDHFGLYERIDKLTPESSEKPIKSYFADIVRRSRIKRVAGADPQSSLVDLTVQLNPPERAGVDVFAKLKVVVPLDIVVNMPFITHLVNAVVPPPGISTAGIDFSGSVRSMTGSAYESLKVSLSQKTNIDVDISLQAPVILVPLTCYKEVTQVLEIDAGKLTIKSDTDQIMRSLLVEQKPALDGASIVSAFRRHAEKPPAAEHEKKIGSDAPTETTSLFVPSDLDELSFRAVMSPLDGENQKYYDRYKIGLDRICVATSPFKEGVDQGLAESCVAPFQVDVRIAVSLVPDEEALDKILIAASISDVAVCSNNSTIDMFLRLYPALSSPCDAPKEVLDTSMIENLGTVELLNDGYIRTIHLHRGQIVLKPVKSIEKTRPEIIIPIGPSVSIIHHAHDCKSKTLKHLYPKEETAALAVPRIAPDDPKHRIWQAAWAVDKSEPSNANSPFVFVIRVPETHTSAENPYEAGRAVPHTALWLRTALKPDGHRMVRAIQKAILDASPANMRSERTLESVTTATDVAEDRDADVQRVTRVILWAQHAVRLTLELKNVELTVYDERGSSFCSAERINESGIRTRDIAGHKLLQLKLTNMLADIGVRPRDAVVRVSLSKIRATHFFGEGTNSGELLQLGTSAAPALTLSIVQSALGSPSYNHRAPLRVLAKAGDAMLSLERSVLPKLLAYLGNLGGLVNDLPAGVVSPIVLATSKPLLQSLVSAPRKNDTPLSPLSTAASDALRISALDCLDPSKLQAGSTTIAFSMGAISVKLTNYDTAICVASVGFLNAGAALHTTVISAEIAIGDVTVDHFVPNPITGVVDGNFPRIIGLAPGVATSISLKFEKDLIGSAAAASRDVPQFSTRVALTVHAVRAVVVRYAVEALIQWADPSYLLGPFNAEAKARAVKSKAPGKSYQEAISEAFVENVTKEEELGAAPYSGDFDQLSIVLQVHCPVIVIPAGNITEGLVLNPGSIMSSSELVASPPSLYSSTVGDNLQVWHTRYTLTLKDTSICYADLRTEVPGLFPSAVDSKAAIQTEPIVKNLHMSVVVSKPATIPAALHVEGTVPNLNVAMDINEIVLDMSKAAYDALHRTVEANMNGTSNSLMMRPIAVTPDGTGNTNDNASPTETATATDGVPPGSAASSEESPAAALTKRKLISVVMKVKSFHVKIPIADVAIEGLNVGFDSWSGDRMHLLVAHPSVLSVRDVREGVHPAVEYVVKFSSELLEDPVTTPLLEFLKAPSSEVTSNVELSSVMSLQKVAVNFAPLLCSTDPGWLLALAEFLAIQSRVSSTQTAPPPADISLFGVTTSADIIITDPAFELTEDLYLSPEKRLIICPARRKGEEAFAVDIKGNGHSINLKPGSRGRARSGLMDACIIVAPDTVVSFQELEFVNRGYVQMPAAAHTCSGTADVTSMLLEYAVVAASHTVVDAISSGDSTYWIIRSGDDTYDYAKHFNEPASSRPNAESSSKKSSIVKKVAESAMDFSVSIPDVVIRLPAVGDTLGSLLVVRLAASMAFSSCGSEQKESAEFKLDNFRIYMTSLDIEARAPGELIRAVMHGPSTARVRYCSCVVEPGQTSPCTGHGSFTPTGTSASEADNNLLTRHRRERRLHLALEDPDTRVSSRVLSIFYNWFVHAKKLAKLISSATFDTTTLAVEDNTAPDYEESDFGDDLLPAGEEITLPQPSSDVPFDCLFLTLDISSADLVLYDDSHSFGTPLLRASAHSISVLHAPGQGPTVVIYDSGSSGRRAFELVEVTLSANFDVWYYNPRVVTWEPVVEPLRPRIDISVQPAGAGKSLSTSIKMTSPEALAVIVSNDLFVSVLRLQSSLAQLMKTVDAANANRPEDKEAPDLGPDATTEQTDVQFGDVIPSPEAFVFVNDTGLDVRLTGTSTGEAILIPGSNPFPLGFDAKILSTDPNVSTMPGRWAPAPVGFSLLETAARAYDDESTESSTVGLEVLSVRSAESPFDLPSTSCGACRLNVTRDGTCRLPIHASGMYDRSIAADVRIMTSCRMFGDGTPWTFKCIRLRSRFRIRNATSLMLETSVVEGGPPSANALPFEKRRTILQGIENPLTEKHDLPYVGVPFTALGDDMSIYIRHANKELLGERGQTGPYGEPGPGFVQAFSMKDPRRRATCTGWSLCINGLNCNCPSSCKKNQRTIAEYDAKAASPAENTLDPHLVVAWSITEQPGHPGDCAITLFPPITVVSRLPCAMRVTVQSSVEAEPPSIRVLEPGAVAEFFHVDPNQKATLVVEVLGVQGTYLSTSNPIQLLRGTIGALQQDLHLKDTRKEVDATLLLRAMNEAVLPDVPARRIFISAPYWFIDQTDLHELKPPGVDIPDSLCFMSHKGQPIAGYCSKLAVESPEPVAWLWGDTRRCDGPEGHDHLGKHSQKEHTTITLGVIPSTSPTGTAANSVSANVEISGIIDSGTVTVMRPSAAAGPDVEYAMSISIKQGPGYFATTRVVRVTQQVAFVNTLGSPVLVVPALLRTEFTEQFQKFSSADSLEGLIPADNPVKDFCLFLPPNMGQGVDSDGDGRVDFRDEYKPMPFWALPPGKTKDKKSPDARRVFTVIRHGSGWAVSSPFSVEAMGSDNVLVDVPDVNEDVYGVIGVSVQELLSSTYVVFTPNNSPPFTVSNLSWSKILVEEVTHLSAAVTAISKDGVIQVPSSSCAAVQRMATSAFHWRREVIHDDDGARRLIAVWREGASHAIVIDPMGVADAAGEDSGNCWCNAGKSNVTGLDIRMSLTSLGIVVLVNDLRMARGPVILSSFHQLGTGKHLARANSAIPEAPVMAFTFSVRTSISIALVGYLATKGDPGTDSEKIVASSEPTGKRAELLHILLSDGVTTISIALSGSIYVSSTLQHIHIDNLLPDAIFPVVVSDEMSAQRGSKPALSTAILMRPAIPNVPLRFDYVSLSLQSLIVTADDEFIESILNTLKCLLKPADIDADDTSRMMRQFVSLRQSPSVATAAKATLNRVWIRQLVIHSMSMSLTFTLTGSILEAPQLSAADSIKPLLTTIGNLSDAPIQLAALKLDNVFDNPKMLGKRITRHYIRAGIFQLAFLLGSIGVIGSPMGLFKNVSAGVKALYYEPASAEVLDPISLGKGVGRGLGSLGSKVLYGVSSSGESITSSIGRGLSHLTLDSDYIRERQLDKVRNKPKHLGDGLLSAGTGVTKSIFDGITGVVTAPIKGAVKDGALGFVKGLGSGVLGLAVKPLVGIADGVSSITGGLRGTAELFDPSQGHHKGYARPPRVIPIDGVLPVYNPLNDAAAWTVSHDSQKKFANDGFILAFVSTGSVICFTGRRIVGLRPEKMRTTQKGSQAALLSDLTDSVEVRWKPKSFSTGLVIQWVLPYQEMSEIEVKGGSRVRTKLHKKIHGWQEAEFECGRGETLHTVIEILRRFATKAQITFTDRGVGDNVVEIWENQRKFGFANYGDVRLPTDRPLWSDHTGHYEQNKERGFKPPPGCKWDSDWLVDRALPDCDNEGWIYAGDFPQAYGPKNAFSWVRRRRWIRRFIDSDDPNDMMLASPTDFSSDLTTSRSSFITDGGESRSSSAAVLSQADNEPALIYAVFENQRKFPIFGWGNKLLPTDRSRFSDADGRKLPSLENTPCPGSSWNSDWYPDLSFGDKVRLHMYLPSVFSWADCHHHIAARLGIQRRLPRRVQRRDVEISLRPPQKVAP